MSKASSRNGSARAVACAKVMRGRRSDGRACSADRVQPPLDPGDERGRARVTKGEATIAGTDFENARPVEVRRSQERLGFHPVWIEFTRHVRSSEESLGS